jgi:hypothetical protein
MAEAFPETAADMDDNTVAALHRWNAGVNQVIAAEAERRRHYYREQARELVTLADTFLIEPRWTSWQEGSP